jgi:hypothetical protein
MPYTIHNDRYPRSNPPASPQYGTREEAERAIKAFVRTGSAQDRYSVRTAVIQPR